MRLLRRIPALLLAVTLALAVGIVPATALLLAAPAAQEEGPAILGYYQSDVIPGEEGAPDLVVGLILYEDGTAEVISDYDDGTDIITEVGTWVDNGDETVTLTVTGTTEGDYAAPIDLVFDVAEDGSLVVPGAENGAFGLNGLILLPMTMGNSDAILAQIPAEARVYQSDVMPAASSPGLQLTLALFEDGSLTLVSDYMNPGEIVVEIGTWSEAEDSSLAISLTGQIEEDGDATTEYDAPLEFVFTVNDDGSLSLVDEEGALFGEAGLTLIPTEATGEATAEATPEATEEATPEATEEATPEATEEATAEATPEATEEATEEAATEEEIVGEDAITTTMVMTPSGAYVSDLLPSDDEGGNFFVTLFYDDGNLLFSTYSLNGDLPILEVGSWAGNDDGTFTITVTGTVDEDYTAPVEVPITFNEDGTINIAGVPLYPLEDIDLSAAPSLVAEFQSEPITDTIDLTHTLTLAAYDDFSAELITTYEEEGEVYTEYGEWEVDESTDQLTVTLTGDDEIEYEEPVEWIFDVTEDDTLVLANDDEGYYGEDGLTLFGVAIEAEELSGEEATEDAAAEETSAEETAASEADAAALEGVQIFQSEVLPAASSPGLQLTLGLADDGSAAMDYDYLNGEEVVTNLGEWVDNGDGTLTITLTEGPNGALELPVEFTLELDADGNLVITDASEESLGFLDVVLAPVVLE